MRVIYYSLAALGNRACERQWIQSIRSLRRHNAEIPVYLILYGVPLAETRLEASRWGVRVIDAGAYRHGFSRLPPPWAEVLEHNVTLHKVLSLRHFVMPDIDQVLYLDCDTYFFGDVESLFDLYCGRHFTAREEPGSRRSHEGYDAGYIDEDALERLARGEGLAPIPPYNTGVFLMNGGLWEHLRALADHFLVCVWRLMVGLRFASPLGASPDDVVATLIERSATAADQRHCFTYPSSNAWIVEEIALWLTLGRVAGLTHDVFQRAHVLQNGETLRIGRGRPHPVVAHYFSTFERQFFAHLSAL
jgi:hypothetical protein